MFLEDRMGKDPVSSSDDLHWMSVEVEGLREDNGTPLPSQWCVVDGGPHGGGSSGRDTTLFSSSHVSVMQASSVSSSSNIS